MIRWYKLNTGRDTKGKHRWGCCRVTNEAKNSWPNDLDTCYRTLLEPAGHRACSYVTFLWGRVSAAAKGCLCASETLVGNVGHMGLVISLGILTYKEGTETSRDWLSTFLSCARPSARSYIDLILLISQQSFFFFFYNGVLVSPL